MYPHWAILCVQKAFVQKPLALTQAASTRSICQIAVCVYESVCSAQLTMLTDSQCCVALNEIWFEWGRGERQKETIFRVKLILKVVIHRQHFRMRKTCFVCVFTEARSDAATGDQRKHTVTLDRITGNIGDNRKLNQIYNNGQVAFDAEMLNVTIKHVMIRSKTSLWRLNRSIARDCWNNMSEGCTGPLSNSHGWLGLGKKTTWLS